MIALGAIASGLAACSEQRAARLVEQADALAGQGRYEEAIVLLERVEGEFASTRAAENARRQRVLYRGLWESELKADLRRAKEEMLALGRALFEYHRRHRVYPPTLANLSAAQPLPLSDPWGRGYLYVVQADARRYRLGCLGEDGSPGGEGNDRDLWVSNGVFIEDLPWGDR